MSNFSKKFVAKMCMDSYCSLYCYCYKIIQDICKENGIQAISFDDFCHRLSLILNDKTAIDENNFNKMVEIYKKGFNL